jgi:hypothetical protein
MTAVCLLASNHEKLDTQNAFNARTLRVAAGFDMHLVITVIDLDASSGVMVHAPRGWLVRNGELAAISDQLIADEAAS